MFLFLLVDMLVKVKYYKKCYKKFYIWFFDIKNLINLNLG